MADSSPYQQIVDNALEVIGARLVILSRYAPDEQAIFVDAWAAPHSEVLHRTLAAIQRAFPDFDPGRLKVPISSNQLMRSTYLEGKPLARPFVELARGTVDDFILRTAATLMNLHHGFICPFFLRDQVAGSLGFYTPDVLSATERRTCEAFVRQTALTLENAQFLAEERRRANQGEHLARTLSQVGAAGDLRGALTALARGALALLDGHLGVARVVDPQSGQDSLVVEVAPDGRPVVSNSSTASSRSTDGTTGTTGQLGPLHAGINVPIEARGARIGSLHVHHPIPGFYSLADLALAEALGIQAGAVIERIRLEEERRHAEAERARLDGALLVSRTVAHEINNALSPIAGYAELLSLLPVLAHDPHAAAYLALISQAADEAAEKVRRLQRIIRLEETPSPLGADRPVLDLERSTAALTHRQIDK